MLLDNTFWTFSHLKDSLHVETKLQFAISFKVMQIHTRWICNFCSAFCRILYWTNFIIPDRIKRRGKDYCSVCIEMRLSCKEQAECQRFWSIQPSARKSCERKQQQAHGRTKTRPSASRSCGLLELKVTHTVGSFLSPDITLLKSHMGILWGEPIWAVAASQKQTSVDHWAQPGQRGSWLHALSLSREWQWRNQLLGKGHWTLPPPSLLPWWSLWRRGWKSLSVLPGKETKALSGWWKTKRKGFVSN